MAWVLLVLAYGLIKGLREIFKKKALGISSPIEVLFLYTLLSFLIVSPEIRNAAGVPAGTLALIAVKSFAIFLAWMCGFNAINKMPVGLYSILDLARVLFSTLLGVIVIGEHMGIVEIISCLVVCVGLVLLRFCPGERKAEAGEKVAPIFVVLTLISCFLNAVSGIFDKILMSGDNLTDGQLQFWYMLFLVVYYGAYILIRRPEFHLKASLKNGWIWILAILFVVADRFLFIANGYPDSKVTVMTLIKQSCCIVTIIGGYIVFKEKHILYKLMCAAIVIAGISLSVFF